MNTTGIGGTETFTLELCNYINSMGSNVSILNMQNSYLLESSSKKYSIDYYSISGINITKIHKTIKMIRKSNIDIVMGYGMNVSMLLLFVKMALPMIKIIIGIRGLLTWRKAYVIRMLNIAETISCDLVIANCNAVLSNKLVASPRVYKKSIVINNGIDTEYYRRGENISDIAKSTKVTFLTVANYLPVKGHEFLLHAVSHLSEYLDRIEFIWIGRGPEKLNLERAIEKNDLSGSISLVGYHENVKEALGNADAFILPSKIEGLPRALLEAMSMSLPCIATAVGGNSELIDHGISGYLVNHGDVNSMKKYIIELSISDKIRRKVGIRARQEIIQHHSSSTASEKYYELFRRYANYL